MRTYRDVLREKGFEWDDAQELWKKSLGFGRKITVDLMFKNLFIVTSGSRKIHDNFVGSLNEFEEIINKI
tara:strand:+ start:4365 stop:4574 length:210 start_codon:yes stop_codon:yes gene_type:complete